MGYRISGLENVMANLQKQIKGIEVRSVKGLVETSILVRRETETTSPLTPVDLGNLRASYFTVSTVGTVPVADTGTFRNKPGKSGKSENRAAKLQADHARVISESQALARSKKQKAVVVFGYSANYAMAVHEKMAAEFQRPGAGPKWFEAAIKRNKSQIVKIIKRNAKIK